MMASFGREPKSSKQQQVGGHADNAVAAGLQGLSKAAAEAVGADLSSSGANRLNSGLLYQPYDAISKELMGGSPGCNPGEKGMGGVGGLLGSGGPMMPGERSRDSSGHSSGRREAEERASKKPHIKKPLNAFMLYMKDMRANVVAECTLKESAAINQILGRRVSMGERRRGASGE